MVTIKIRDVSVQLDICEANIQGACQHGASCHYHHHSAPYLWQIHLQDKGWRNIFEESMNIEKAYCNQHENITFQMPATATDGTSFKMDVEINFEAMKAQLTSRMLPAGGVVVEVRRLSTQSYVKTVEARGADECPGTVFHTQWRWYWWSDGSWQMFSEAKGTPRQYIIEAKFLAKQDVFRFEEKKPIGYVAPPSPHRSTPLVFILNYQENRVVCLNNNNKWRVIRRPLFIDHELIKKKIALPNPPVRLCTLLPMLPDDWFPSDPDQQYELVPLNPSSMGYHLVASEFHSTLSMSSRHIVDVFRVQNPYLWHQFSVKKTLMLQRSSPSSLEQQLFHGTNDDSVVQAICRDNFDWRVSGKHNIVFGKGSYFAKDAAYSDKYTGSSNKKLRWIFLARVLVGKYTKGNSSLVRPPPLDIADPHGELYDSCVNDVNSPSIYVIFEKDQCYPEYLISYTTDAR